MSTGRKKKRPAAPSVDGRIQRGERNRQSIVDALLELVGQGSLQPTAQQVAQRAGVGIRTVFRHFSEMDTLYQAMDSHLEGDARALVLGGERSGALGTRISTLVQRRAALFERISPYKRAANLNRWRSPFLESRHQVLLRGLRNDLLGWLPELKAAPAPLLEAVDLLMSFEAWERLRQDRHLSRKAATAVVEGAVVALVGATARKVKAEA